MTIVREPSGKRGILDGAAIVGRAGCLMFEALAFVPHAVFRRNARRDFMECLYNTGILSLPVITIVGLFTGMILGLQVGLALSQFNQEMYLGASVMISLLREMAPFVTGICLSACVGSRLAAELGTMKVNDEIAALETMSISPVRFLVTPRVLSLVVMAPLLSFYTVVLGVLGGGLVGYTQLNVPFLQYMASAMSIAETKDLYVGLLKSGVFGLIIGVVSCHEGLFTSMGAVGVGRATQKSVIVSFLLILMFGYMLTRLFYLG